MNKELKTLLVITLLVLTASQLLLFTGSKPSFRIENIKNISDYRYLVEYSVLTGDYKTEMNVVYFPIDGELDEDLPIYILYDDGYDTYKSWQPYFMIVSGLYNELRYEARLRELNNDINVINSTALSKVFIENRKAIVIIPTVTWWVELSSPKIDEDLMDSWVENGGVLIWLGASPDNLYGLRFLNETFPIEGWNNLENWGVSDIPANKPNQVKVSSVIDGNATLIKLTHPSALSVHEGFYGALVPSRELDLSSGDFFLSFQMKINILSYFSLIFVRVEDIEGNYRDYWLHKDVSSFSEQLIKSEWEHFSANINFPDKQSENPMNLNSIERIWFVFSTKNDVNIDSKLEVYIKDLKIEKGVTVVTSKWRLIEANKDSPISRMLNLKYGYVDLGVSIDKLSMLNGVILGKIYDERNAEKRTSIALIPYGVGKVVVFGYGIFPPYYQNFVAEDVMQIIHSGILYASGFPRYKSYELGKNMEIRDQIELNLQVSNTWMLFAFSKERHSGFAGENIVLHLTASSADG